MLRHIDPKNGIELIKDTTQKTVRNILFITSTRIGDAVLSTGIVEKLAADYPEAKITIACGPVAAPLFAAAPNLARVIALKKQKYSLHWFKLWAEVAKTHWDIVVDLRRSLMPWLLWTDKRYTLAKNKGAEKQHRVLENSAVLKSEKPLSPKVWVAREHIRGAERRMYNKTNILAIGPAANWKAKTWRAENFIELINRLTHKDGIFPAGNVAVFGAENEREQIKPLLAAIPKERLIDCVGGLSLLSTQACLMRCEMYIGNDSGLMHMAAAAGIPTLGLFGPTNEKLYAPWGDRAAVVRTETPLESIFPEGFDHRNCDTLMDTLSVDKAEDAAWDLWHRFHRMPLRKGK